MRARHALLPVEEAAATEASRRLSLPRGGARACQSSLTRMSWPARAMPPSGRSRHARPNGSSGSGSAVPVVSACRSFHEFYVVVTREMTPGMPRQEARADVRDLFSWQPLALSEALMESAWRVQDDHGVSFWDALILAAAVHAGCEHVLSEDLQDGRGYGDTVALNPFLHHPAELGL